MGTEKPLMDYLNAWENALDSPASLQKLREQTRRTPKSFAFEDLFPGSEHFGVTANHMALIAAVALVDAVDLRCPGTDEGLAIRLVETLFDLQMQNGFMCHGAGRQEVFTSSHGQLWDAAFAAVLHVASKRRIEGLLGQAAGWWRQRIDLWADHVTAEQTILAPCLRGGRSENATLAANTCDDAINNFIRLGHRRKLAPENRYMLGARLFYRMENLALNKPAHPWPLPAKLTRLRYPDGYVSFFSELHGPNAQWMVGTTARRPSGAVSVPGGWAVFAHGAAENAGGPCPVAPPGGWSQEKTYPVLDTVPGPAPHEIEPIVIERRLAMTPTVAKALSEWGLGEPTFSSEGLPTYSPLIPGALPSGEPQEINDIGKLKKEPEGISIWLSLGGGGQFGWQPFNEEDVQHVLSAMIFQRYGRSLEGRGTGGHSTEVSAALAGLQERGIEPFTSDLRANYAGTVGPAAMYDYYVGAGGRTSPLAAIQRILAIERPDDRTNPVLWKDGVFIGSAPSSGSLPSPDTSASGELKAIHSTITTVQGLVAAARADLAKLAPRGGGPTASRFRQLMDALDEALKDAR